MDLFSDKKGASQTKPGRRSEGSFVLKVVEPVTAFEFAICMALESSYS